MDKDRHRVSTQKQVKYYFNFVGQALALLRLLKNHYLMILNEGLPLDLTLHYDTVSMGRGITILTKGE